MNTWIPGQGWMTFGRPPQVVLEEFVPVSDPDPRSPYHIPSQHVPAVAAEQPPERVPAPGERARLWLATELAEGPVPTLHLQERAQAAGHSWSTIRRMRKAAGAEVFKDGRGEWKWRLTEDA
jgi:hypothetical protein